MTDYIKEAVELADGWSWSDCGLNIRIEGFCQFATIDGVLEQPLLDALAAQLVRQVYAKTDIETIAYDLYPSNKIMEIVKSGVLK